MTHMHLSHNYVAVTLRDFVSVLVSKKPVQLFNKRSVIPIIAQYFCNRFYLNTKITAYKHISDRGHLACDLKWRRAAI